MKEKHQKWSREEFKEVLYCFYYALEQLSKFGTTGKKTRVWQKRKKNKRTYIDANKLANVRRDIIKNERFTKVEIIMIKDELKTARNRKGNQQADNTETESEDEVKFLGFIQTDCKVIVEDVVGNAWSANENVN